MREADLLLVTLAMLLGTGTFIYLVHSIKSAILGRAKGRVDDELLGEIRALRMEMQALRQQNNEVVLTLDSSLDRMDRRLSYLETRPQPQEPERRQIGLGR
ncbi:MAG: hypothetical protein ACK47B_03655 [Armatimonadota bacterium]